MALKTLTIIGKKATLEVFRIKTSIPIPVLGSIPFPPSLGALPIPKLPSLSSLGIKGPNLSWPSTGTSGSKIPNAGGGGTSAPNFSFPNLKLPKLPIPALGSIPFPPSLGALPLPKLPTLKLPSLSTAGGGFKIGGGLSGGGPSGSGGSFNSTLPSLKLPTLPTAKLGSIPFPPSLGALPLPKLPTLPSLPTALTGQMKGLNFPYLKLPTSDGGNAQSAPLTITTTVT